MVPSTTTDGPGDESRRAQWLSKSKAGRGEVDKVVGPLPDDLRVADGARGSLRRPRAVGRALRGRGSRGSAGRRVPSVRARPGTSGSSSRQAGGDEQSAATRCDDHRPSMDPEAGAAGSRYKTSETDPVQDISAVPGAPRRVRGRVGRRAACRPATGSRACGGRALRGGPVDHDHPAAGAGQDQRGRQAGGSAADDRYVACVHGLERAARRRTLVRNQSCRCGETAVQ